VAVFDGDTPPDHRRKAREARVVVTNPDMLHAGILPQHASWARFFSGLNTVVVDELHTCRGVYGSGVANVIRRLRRVAGFHGARPRFVATSATIANPGELGARVLGTDRLRVITESGAPLGERTFVIYNPPVIDPSLGLRASYLKATRRLTRDLVDAGVATLVFARSRKGVEILVRYLRDDVDGEGEDPDDIRGYRGGYLPDRRRDVEAKLRSGEARCVVATSALELGIDVGGLDAVVIAGWPGSRAAAWQRAGRAGRRGKSSLVVLVACSEPLDQYVAADPGYLHGEPPEHGRVDPDNLAILVPHLRCAAFELPFARGESFGALSGEETAEVLRYLGRRGDLHEQEGNFTWIGEGFPAGAVPLRGAIEENFTVIERREDTVLAEVDRRDAARYLHEKAIYPLEGALYQVDRLEWNAHKAYVSLASVDFTTEAMTHTRVSVVEELAAAGPAGFGDVHVEERVIGFKKIKLHTHENVGYGEVKLPAWELSTRGLWFDPVEGLVGGVEPAGHALKGVSALIVLCDGADLGRATGEPEPASRPALPRIYLFDRHTGGAGLCEKLFEERAALVARAIRLVDGCACAHGCPGCVGAVNDGKHAAKQAALQVLRGLAARLGGVA
jgi:DEAD/DEAH box helicase domain-containing protein